MRFLQVLDELDFPGIDVLRTYTRSIKMDSTSPYAFPLHPKEYAPEPVPSIQEWRQLWAAWELVTLKMIPNSALHEKPIPLRNELVFYLGHIPTL